MNGPQQVHDRAEPASGRWLSREFEPGLVSVLIPTYNRAHLLGPTLGSILDQTYERVEVVVVDDGSTDDTPQVLEKWNRRFDHQRGWRLRSYRQARGGGPAARNAAAAACSGQYLNFFDDDDLMAADKIAVQVAALEAAGADLAYGPHQLFRQQNDRYWLGLHCNQQPQPFADGLLPAWLGGWDWALQASLLRREFAASVGPWDETLARGQDLEYKIRCLQHEPRFAHAPGGATFVRRHTQSVSHTLSADAQQSVLRTLLKFEQVCLEQMGPEMCRPLLARYWARRAIKAYEEGSREAAQVCQRKVREHQPDWRPVGLRAAERMAYRLGGFRLAGAVNRLRKRLGRLRSGLGLGSRQQCVDRLPLGSVPENA